MLIHMRFHNKIHKKVSQVFLNWLPFGFVITMMCGLVFLVSQFQIRSEVRVQLTPIVEEITQALEKGVPPEALGINIPVDMANTHSSYFILYAPDRRILAGNVLLEGQTPIPPRGVFEYAKYYGSDIVTWQPMRGVRQAIDMVYYHPNGSSPMYILVGHPLRETEQRICTLFYLIELAWAMTMIGSLAVMALVSA